MKWNPIETAPKNGEWLILYNEEMDFVTNGYYASFDGGKPVLYVRDGFKEAENEFTHWMIMPEADTYKGETDGNNT